MKNKTIDDIKRESSDIKEMTLKEFVEYTGKNLELGELEVMISGPAWYQTHTYIPTKYRDDLFDLIDAEEKISLSKLHCDVYDDRYVWVNTNIDKMSECDKLVFANTTSEILSSKVTDMFLIFFCISLDLKRSLSP